MTSSSEVGHRTERRSHGSVSPPSRLEMKLGDDGFLELREMLDVHEGEWKRAVLEIATARFERRLTEESTRLIRWMFGFFVAYLGVTLSLMGMILHSAKL